MSDKQSGRSILGLFGFLTILAAAFVAGAVGDRIFLRGDVTEDNIKSVAFDVAKKDIKQTISRGGVKILETEGGPVAVVDPLLNALIHQESNWPGTIEWFVRYGGQARILYEENNGNYCPEILLRGRDAFCVFKRPIQRDPTRGGVYPSDRIVRQGVISD